MSAHCCVRTEAEAEILALVSASNADLAARGAVALSQRDLEGFLEVMDDDVETRSRLVAFEGSYLGLEGARRYWDDLHRAFPDFRFDLERVHEVGSVTITEGRLRAHGAESTTPIDQKIWTLAKWRNSKCIWWGPTFLSESEALEAASDESDSLGGTSP